VTRQAVRSDAISSLEYFPRGSTLEVEFKDGQVWRYSPVGPDEYAGLLVADSVGEYFNRRIRDKARIRVRVL